MGFPHFQAEENQHKLSGLCFSRLWSLIVFSFFLPSPPKKKNNEKQKTKPSKTKNPHIAISGTNYKHLLGNLLSLEYNEDVHSMFWRLILWRSCQSILLKVGGGLIRALFAGWPSWLALKSHSGPWLLLPCTWAKQMCLCRPLHLAPARESLICL